MHNDRRTTAPHGTWPSPLSAADLASASTGFSDLRVDGDAVTWLQRDPATGRYAVVRHDGAGAPRTISPEGFNARTRVNEYGGGALATGHGVVLACSWEDQRVHRIADGAATPVTPAPSTPAGIRWQGMQILPGGTGFVAVRETHGPDRPRSNPNAHGDEEALDELVHVDLTTGTQTVLVTGPDFVSGPWVDPSGTRIAWLRWDHPDMPWDAAELWAGRLDGDGLTAVVHVAGGTRPDGTRTAVVDAHWTGDGRLLFVDDPTGWWNVHVWDGQDVTALHVEHLEVGGPRWTPSSSLTTLGDDTWAVARGEGLPHLRRIGRGALAVDGLTAVADLAATADALVVIGGGPELATDVWRIDPRTGARTPLGDAPDHPAAAIGAVPRPITFPTPDGATAHALHYPPTSATHRGPDDEAPPLVVLSHGGPTSAATTGLQPLAQYWASRGFAVVDVDYRGSTGYGRAYRDALRGAWGRHDVTDCVAAAAHLVAEGHADGDRLIIEGGSAGGFTTLLALCTTDVFAAGGNAYGVSDLRALARDTHKFEARYLDSLIGPWPAAEAEYVARSPISHVDALRTPTIVLQGDDDPIVPPSQSEAIVAALEARGIPHAYLLFEGEQHGFRMAANVVRALEARLAFYGHVLGFVPADDVPVVLGRA